MQRSVRSAASPRIVLATDGLRNDLVSQEQSVVAGRHLEQAAQAYAMADALRYRRRGSHDDRTAVVVAFLESGPTESP